MSINSFWGIELETQVGVGYMWQCVGPMLCGGIEEWSSLSVALPFSYKLFSKNPVKKNTAELGKGTFRKVCLVLFFLGISPNFC